MIFISTLIETVYPHIGASWTMFAGGQVGDQDPWGQLKDKIVMK